MSHALVEGELVLLRSGGPVMCVEVDGVSPAPTFFQCVWFLDGEVKRDCFHSSALVPVGELKILADTSK